MRRVRMDMGMSMVWRMVVHVVLPCCRAPLPLMCHGHGDNTEKTGRQEEGEGEIFLTTEPRQREPERRESG